MLTRPAAMTCPSSYSGTLVVQGQGIAEVRATGMQHRDRQDRQGAADARAGGDALAAGDRPTGRAIWQSFGLSLCVLVVVVIYGLTRGDWLNGFLAGITLAMAMLPEEFPVVLTIFLALGAWRISQQATCSPAACRPSKRSARPRCCAWTRPAR